MLLKTDDDVLLALPEWLDIASRQRRPFLFGDKSEPRKANRFVRVHSRRKWSTPEYIFKEWMYPTYVRGLAYAMDRQTAACVANSETIGVFSQLSVTERKYTFVYRFQICELFAPGGLVCRPGN